MNHEQLEQMLPDYARNGLSAEDAGLLRVHLESCPLCQNRLASLQTVSRMIDASAPGMPEAYFQTILPRFRAGLEERQHRRFDWGASWIRWAAPVVAAVVAVGLLTAIPIGPAGTDQNGLRALANEIGSNEMTEFVLDEMETTMIGSRAQDVIAHSVPQTTVARQLLEQLAGESVLEELSVLRTVEDLENDELDVILRRLEQRKFL